MNSSDSALRYIKSTKKEQTLRLAQGLPRIPGSLQYCNTFNIKVFKTISKYVVFPAPVFEIVSKLQKVAVTWPTPQPHSPTPTPQPHPTSRPPLPPPMEHKCV